MWLDFNAIQTHFFEVYFFFFFNFFLNAPFSNNLNLGIFNLGFLLIAEEKSLLSQGPFNPIGLVMMSWLNS